MVYETWGLLDTLISRRGSNTAELSITSFSGKAFEVSRLTEMVRLSGDREKMVKRNSRNLVEKDKFKMVK